MCHSHDWSERFCLQIEQFQGCWLLRVVLDSVRFNPSLKQANTSFYYTTHFNQTTPLHSICGPTVFLLVGVGNTTHTFSRTNCHQRSSGSSGTGRGCTGSYRGGGKWRHLLPCCRAWWNWSVGIAEISDKKKLQLKTFLEIVSLCELSLTLPLQFTVNLHFIIKRLWTHPILANVNTLDTVWLDGFATIQPFSSFLLKPWVQKCNWLWNAFRLLL